MAEKQLMLFATRSVLAERLGDAFFRSVPRCPGVYLMSDETSRVIYVGKAKDLRARVGSYHYASGRCSRKTARLVARVAHIRWELCSSEEEALLQENRLLRELRPRFNRVNTWPKAYRFIRIDASARSVVLSLTGESEGECYGAFKGASRQTFGALLRLLSGLNGRYAELPRRLVCERLPGSSEFNIECAAHWLDPLRSFLRGESDELLKHVGALPTPAECPFHLAYRAADFAAVEQFFAIGPRRNYSLRRRRGGDNHLIAQEILDDLIVRDRACS